MLRNSTEAWGAVAKSLHWSMALLLLPQLLLGALAPVWPLSPTKIELFVWHKSLGLLLLLLVLVRLAWRCTNPVPRLPPATPNWQRRASRASHLLLYVCMIALPLTGWIINSASKVPLKVFWLFRLPAITAPDKELAVLMKTVHAGLVVLLLLLLVLHVAAALHHHFVSRDDVLQRMLPGWRR